MIVCVGFFVCWSAIEIIYFLSFVGYAVTQNNWFHFSVVLVYVSSCINPFIYTAKYAEFQIGVRRMVARVTGRPQHVEASGVGHVMTSSTDQPTPQSAAI